MIGGGPRSVQLLGLALTQGLRTTAASWQFGRYRRLSTIQDRMSTVPSWPIGAARHRREPNSKRQATPFGPLVNSGYQSNFSRSHEHATHVSTCNRHPSDAAVPTLRLTRVSAPTYARTYARAFLNRRLSTHASSRRSSGENAANQRSVHSLKEGSRARGVAGALSAMRAWLSFLSPSTSCH